MLNYVLHSRVLSPSSSTSVGVKLFIWLEACPALFFKSFVVSEINWSPNDSHQRGEDSCGFYHYRARCTFASLEINFIGTSDVIKKVESKAVRTFFIIQ